MLNGVISGIRSAGYNLIEPINLRLLRIAWEYDYNLIHTPFDPLVSVYVPTFNRADLLIERSLKSIRAQTYKHFEVIVVAHGCTDDTVQRVHALGDKRIRVIEIPRTRTYPDRPENHWFAGRVAPANAGLAACKGMYIATNDDDDVWTPSHIELLLRFAQRGDYEFVSARHDTHEGLIEPYDVDGVKVGGLQTWLYRSYLREFKFNSQCWRKSWNSVCDTDLQDRFRKAGVRMGYLDKIVAHILLRPGENLIGLKAYREERTRQQMSFK